MELINKTTVFEENQVLTAGQLNTMQDFLFQESRLTRIRLIGRGIACGLEASRTGNVYHITKGVGVSSWGFLISLGDCELTHYKEYVYPDGMDYPYFNDSTGNRVKLYELVKAENAVLLGAKLIDAVITAGNYVVVLFLEAATKDLKSCLGKSCDDLGIEKTFTVRKLLISAADLIKVNTVNKNKGGAMYPALYNLETIEYPRALISASQASDYFDLVFSYLNPVDSVLDQLIKQLETIYNELPVLQKNFNVVLADIGTEWHQKLLELATGYISGSAYGFQYVYDAFEDIIKSYEELRCAAMHLNSVCLPDNDAFPMHLMLGDMACPPADNRQEFEYSPLFNDYKSWSKKVVTIFGRILTMLKGYHAEFMKEADEQGVLATPSKEKQQPLGKKAFPIYFNPYLPDFEKFWNDCSCHGCGGEKGLSYHYQLPEEDQDYGFSKLETPLFYNINEYNFFRMEGHLGLDEADAVNRYRRIRRKFNMPFKVKSLFIGDGDEITTTCRYPDLDSQYLVWRNVMLYYLNNLLKYGKIAESMAARYKDVADAVKNAAGSTKTAPETNVRTAKMAGTTEAIEVSTDKVSFFRKASEGVFAAGAFTENLNRTDHSRIFKDNPRAAAPENEIHKELLNWIADFNDNIEVLIAALPLEFTEFDEDAFKDKYVAELNHYVGLMKILARIINRERDKEMLSYLLILTLAHRVLNTMMIRPYITIGTLTDIRKQRNLDLRTSKSFVDYLKAHGGAEHLAGVERGNTLLLIYHAGEQGGEKRRVAAEKEHLKVEGDLVEVDIKRKPFGFRDGEQTEFSKNFAALYEKIGADQALKELGDTVIADFTVYEDDSCCECDPKDYKNKELTPLAVPISRVVSYSATRVVVSKIQVLNNLYHPGFYKVSLATEPVYGEVEFTEEDYEPIPGQKKQILNYTLNNEKIKANRKAGSAIVDIDEFDYLITDDNGDEAGRATITVFINFESLTPQTYKLSGTVSYSKRYTITVLDPAGSVVQEGVFTDGTYSFQLKPGDYVVRAINEQQDSQTGNVRIVDKDEVVDFNFG
ncbi:hypothetical protein [Pedobacter ginsengisoli]|uniref:hypothetical protein n=1 Tax=Pedobacter ginsengisoli TaxID=363852 RepID=UPI00254D7450|nr:hypothetical protein [Pedobacter ginsengisoli]